MFKCLSCGKVMDDNMLSSRKAGHCKQCVPGRSPYGKKYYTDINYVKLGHTRNENIINGEEIKCKQCGRYFISTHGKRILCSDCSSLNKKYRDYRSHLRKHKLGEVAKMTMVHIEDFYEECIREGRYVPPSYKKHGRLV